MNINELNSVSTSDIVKFHDSLNPKLFAGRRLKPQIRSQLLRIAADFLNYMGISNLDIKDIIITGSNAAYSYTNNSDIDLHIILDFNDLNPDDVYRELFDAKKNLYNNNHDIKIHGHDVELYVQDSNEEHVSLGQYSVMNDKWNKLPTKTRAEIKHTAVLSKFKKLEHIIKHAIKSEDTIIVGNILKKLGKYRRGGLERGGEFSSENLVYKLIRRAGLLEKLLRARDQYRSRDLSLPQ